MRSLTILLTLVLAAGIALAADISGKWVFQVETSAGTGSPTFVIEQKGEEITGSYSGALGEAKIRGTVKGDQVAIEFEVEGGGQSAKVEYKGTIENDKKMKGTVKLGSFGEGTWTGARQ
jgi:hypothetical protein